MDVSFQSKRYSNFDRIPTVRAEWGEDLVRRFYESKGFLTFRTKDIDRVNLESNLKDLINALFKNQDFHSVDVVCLLETKDQKEQRLKDEVFVREIMERGKPYDLGRFTKGRYHLDIFYNGSKGKFRREIYLLPHLLFIEVKTYLTTSKPPIISPAELYRLLYWKEKIGSGAVFLAIIEIDLAKKKAILNFVFPEKFHNVKEQWYEFKEPAFVTMVERSGFSRIKLPQVIQKGKEPYTPILSYSIEGNEIRFEAHTLSYEVNIDTV